MERLIGVWKRRFPFLAYGCRLNLNNTLTSIVACGVLYNLARRRGEPEPPLPDDVNEHQLQILLREGNIPVAPNPDNHLLLGHNYRNNLVENYFARL